MKYETAVEDVVIRMEGVKSFRFPRPAQFDFDPGQWMFITIQFGEETKTKHFTISSSPTEWGWIEFTKKITDHEFSVRLDALQPGDWAAIDGPHGSFTFRGEYPRVGMIAGGIGITPMKSMIQYCTDAGMQSQITLLYGNRNEESILFRDELKELEGRNRNLRVIHCLSRPGDGWNGRRGRVDRDAIAEEIPDYSERVFYVCGPPDLVADMVEMLKTLNVSDRHIRKEQFAGY